RLAGTRFADHPEDLAGRDVERNVVERDQRAGPRREFDPQVTHLEQRRAGPRSRGPDVAHRRRGFMASRNQSPNRLMLSAIRTSIEPGKMTSHQAPLKSCLLPSLMKVPSEG